MNISVPDYYKAAEIIGAVKSAGSGTVLCCTGERQFALLKIALVKLQKSDLCVQLVDGHGGVLKQVTTRKKIEPNIADGELSGEQARAVKELERAFKQCRRQGLSVIGFSDGLVAVPEQLGVGLDALSSAAAMEVDSSDCYKGFEAELE